MDINNIIHPSFKCGSKFKIGHFNVIEKNVNVGDNVEVCNFALIKEGTKIGNNCFIDSYVLSSGDCTIGNNVVLRYQSVIARNVVIEDNVFFTAGVKTIFLDHMRTASNKKLIIGEGCFLGDSAVVMGEVKIAPWCVIGACSFVNKDTDPYGVYIGIPSRRIRDVTPEEIESMKNPS